MTGKSILSMNTLIRKFWLISGSQYQFPTTGVINGRGSAGRCPGECKFWYFKGADDYSLVEFGSGWPKTGPLCRQERRRESGKRTTSPLNLCDPRRSPRVGKVGTKELSHTRGLTNIIATPKWSFLGSIRRVGFHERVYVHASSWRVLDGGCRRLHTRTPP